MSNTLSRVDAFTQQELALWAPLLEARIKERAQKLGKNMTSDLVRTVMAKAIGSKEAQLAFAKHGRFLDMGAKRGWRKGVYVGKSRSESLRKPKPIKFYSRTKMGMYGQLVSNLSNKFVDTLIDQAVAATKPE